jgi:hypothetical protein
VEVTGWIHQFDQQPAGQDVVAEAVALGLDRVAVKALDGPDWMAKYDQAPGAIARPEELVNWRSAFANAGIGLQTWVNVTPERLEDQRALWGAILGAIEGRLVLDLEPYRGFWGDRSDCGPVAAALEGLPKERLGLTYDPRVASWPGFDQVVSRVSVLQPQVYELGWLAQAESGRPPGPSILGTQHSIEPLVSVQASASDWLAIATAPSFKASAFGVWLLPIVDPAQRALLKLAGGPAGPAKVDPDFASYAPSTGTWREAAGNLKGVADDALAAGRALNARITALATEAAGLWHGR